MLARTLAPYRRVFDTVRVVIREDEPEIADMVESAGCQVVVATDAAAGQARSLAAGVAASEQADGLVVGLADMPYVQVATLRDLVATMKEHPGHVVRPRHAGRAGNPVGFPASMFKALQAVDGDVGARDVISASDSLLHVDVNDEGVLRDLDTPP